MVLLPHKPKAAAVPMPKACLSNGLYWVSTKGGALRCSCGPHLAPMLGDLQGEGAEVDQETFPAPGTPCEYLEVKR
jgi:hypothetical protein